jgi:hypothetical protein
VCLCDSVEAAARRLKNPTSSEIEQLVHLVVYGKAQSGQLDDSGLTRSDLQSITESLIFALKSAHPSARPAQGSEASTVLLRPGARAEHGPTLQMGSLRLDALDLPRPDWGLVEAPRSGAQSELGFAETEGSPDAAFEPTAPLNSPDPERRATEPRQTQKPLDSGQYDIVDEFGVARTPPPPISEWEDALNATAGDISALAPPMGSHRRPDTDDGQPMNPGMVVVGAPPATHPERAHTEVTVSRPIPMPPEAIPPESDVRPTRELPAEIPPEAIGESTVPRAQRAATEED